MVLQLRKLKMWRYSTTGLLISVVIVALFCATYSLRSQIHQKQMQIEELQNELDASRPIPVVVVKDRFIEQLRDRLPVVVSRIWYNPSEDIYTIEFGYFIDQRTQSGELVGNTVHLHKDIDGTYSGIIDYPIDATIVKIGGRPPLFRPRRLDPKNDTTSVNNHPPER
ncbi:MAG: hypothetical protein ACK6A7_04435 [Planctomycetota bacterium]